MKKETSKLLKIVFLSSLLLSVALLVKDGTATQRMAMKIFSTEKAYAAEQNETMLQQVTIPDLNLQKALMEDLHLTDSKEITKQKLETIQELDLNNRNISSIEGLQYCTNLIKLRIGSGATMGATSNNTISDLTPLKNLKKLTLLYGGGLKVKDFSPIKDIFSNFKIGKMTSDIRFVNQCLIADDAKNFNEDGSFTLPVPAIDIDGTPMNVDLISDGGKYNPGTNTITWTNLTRNTKLTFSCYSKKIPELFLSEYYEQEVTIPDSKKTPVSVPDKYLQAGLNDALNTEKINYISNRKSTAPLFKEDLEQLSGNLNLNNRNISNLKGIENCINVTSLNLDNNNISNVGLLRENRSIKHISLNNNKLTNIDSLFSLSKLQEIKVNDNKIQSLKGISNLKSLEWLFIENNCIEDFSEAEMMADTQNLMGSISGQNIEKKVTLTHDSIEINNPLQSTKNVHFTLSDNGIYDENTNKFYWKNTSGLTSVSISFSNSDGLKISGEIKVDILSDKIGKTYTPVSYSFVKATPDNPSNPTASLIVPPAINFDSKSKIINTCVTLRDTNGTDAYLGTATYIVKVKSMNSYKLIHELGKNVDDVSYSLTDGLGRELNADNTQQELGKLSKYKQTITSNAILKERARSFGNHTDRLIYYFQKSN